MGDDFIVGHGGLAEPAINADVRLDPRSGDGIIVLITGDRGLSPRLAARWVRWKTGRFGLYVLFSLVPAMLRTILGGWATGLMAIAAWS